MYVDDQVYVCVDYKLMCWMICYKITQVQCVRCALMIDEDIIVLEVFQLMMASNSFTFIRIFQLYSKQYINNISSAINLFLHSLHKHLKHLCKVKNCFGAHCGT